MYKIEPPIRAPPEDDYYHTRLIESHVGDYGDVAMHITNEVEIPEFYAIRTTKIPVREVAPYVISKNEIIFFSSQVRQTRTADYVNKPNVSSRGSKRLVAMNKSVGVSGDSGAPWALHSKAYGTHKGDMTLCYGCEFCDRVWCFDHDVFSRASIFPNAIGAVVITADD